MRRDLTVGKHFELSLRDRLIARELNRRALGGSIRRSDASPPMLDPCSSSRRSSCRAATFTFTICTFARSPKLIRRPVRCPRSTPDRSSNCQKSSGKSATRIMPSVKNRVDCTNTPNPVTPVTTPSITSPTCSASSCSTFTARSSRSASELRRSVNDKCLPRFTSVA